MTIDPKQVSVPKFHAFMLGSIAPRPIALASTLDKDGNPNLAPFSFFNCFGSNPPTLIFSPSRSVRENTNKHTLENILETREVVVNAVSYDIVQQVSLASVEFPKGANEFIKSGLTPVPSERVKPFRVKESPANFECIVKDIIETGHEGGAANLIICEIVLMHVNDNVLDENGRVDPHKIDLVARMGNDYYCRASGVAVFEVEKPKSKLAIGYDNIPEYIRMSNILSGNNLGQLGNIEVLPTREEIIQLKDKEDVQDLLNRFTNDKESLQVQLQYLAKDYLLDDKVADAWKVLLLQEYL